jgi:hypothetical protein
VLGRRALRVFAGPKEHVMSHIAVTTQQDPCRRATNVACWAVIPRIEDSAGVCHTFEFFGERRMVGQRQTDALPLVDDGSTAWVDLRFGLFPRHDWPIPVRA